MENLIVIRTKFQLEELAQYIADKHLVAFDCETSGLSRDDTVVGFSIACETESGYYVILQSWEKDKLVPVISREDAIWFLERLKGHHLIAHNSVFDCMMVESNFGVQLMPYMHTDTLLLAHLLDENRSNALKSLAADFFGEDATKEQKEMKESVLTNGGKWSDASGGDKEMYKADSEILGRYGAKDTILTLKLFYTLVPQLFDENLDRFFYEDESMPLLRGPTYDMNTTGLKVDQERLQNLKGELEAECLELKTFILKEIKPYIQDKYPGTSKANTFNIGASQQLAWLLFIKLGQPFNSLTDGGKEVCKALDMKTPYNFKAKREFIQTITDYRGHVWAPEGKSLKTGKIVKAKTVGDPWKYLSADADALELYKNKYNWVEKLCQYNKNMKLLSTYVIGMQEKIKYGIIRPSFNQSGTTSGRYSSSKPNFQNLPRDDKRIKACIIPRPGKIFVGADYSQLEPRVFASQSGDIPLTKCFADKDDFYSVVGTGTFGRIGYSLKKTEEGSFAKMFPHERQLSKEDIALATPYGTTASKMSQSIGKSIEECQQIIDDYLEAFPGVKNFMLESHALVKKNGVVHSIYGRPRRIPEAKNIERLYGNTKHSDLPYQVRTLLNLAVNHRVQSSGASIMNRAAIEAKRRIDANSWKEVKIVLQVHDSLILEGPDVLKEEMAALLKDSMENTTVLPRVLLEAEPKIGCNLSEV